MPGRQLSVWRQLDIPEPIAELFHGVKKTRQHTSGPEGPSRKDSSLFLRARKMKSSDRAAM